MTHIYFLILPVGFFNLDKKFDYFEPVDIFNTYINEFIMELNENKQFVVLPNEVVDCEEISPKSLVVYCAIKQHMDKDTLEAYPGIKTIAAESGCGEDAVRKAIKELVDNKFIEQILRKGQSTVYKFSKTKYFEPFSYDFLQDDKIKIREKAYLMMTQKNMFNKETGIGSMSYTTKEMSKITRMSIPTVLSCENTLIKAGYLTKSNSKLIDKESGVHQDLRMYLLQLYNLAAVTYRQTQQNTEDIQNLQKENKIMKKQIEILTRKVFKEEEELNIII